MNAFIENLAQDLKDYETARARRRQPDAPAPAAGSALRHARALGLLRAEALRVAAMLAASTSLANAAARRPGGYRPMAAPIFMPAFAGAMEAPMAVLAEADTFFELQQHWLAATAKLAFARELATARAAEANRSADQVCIRADIEADAWCRACSVLIVLLEALARHMRDLGVTVTPPHEAQALALLADAAAGRSPCLEADGSFSLPGWAERRRQRRRSFVQAIEISVGSLRLPATSEDLSAAGMQISAGLLLPVGSRLVIHLHTGRRLEATVLWSDGGKAGLAFQQPLSDQDPLWALTDDPAILAE